METVAVKVFMLGWEFPPAVAGGLGVACYGLAKALNSSGVDVLFVLPKPLTKGTAHQIPGGGVVQEIKDITASAPHSIHQTTDAPPPLPLLPPLNPPRNQKPHPTSTCPPRTKQMPTPPPLKNYSASPSSRSTPASNPT